METSERLTAFCCTCKKEKLASLFDSAEGEPSTRSPQCRPCEHKLRPKARKKNRPDRQRSNMLKRKYGITTECYEEMDAACEGECELCGSSNGKRRLAVDHCHRTGKIRGLLCNRCNLAIGYAKDDPLLLRLMADYVEHYQDDSVAAST